jgi:hypothetical protein
MPNVSGEGIGIAARVMSCGGDGHILISARLAESLRNLSEWKNKLKYLGEFRAKKDRVHIWSYVDGETGSTAPLKVPPWKAIVRRRILIAAAAGGLAAAGAVAIGGTGGSLVPERSFKYSLVVKNANSQPETMPPDGFATSGAQIMLRFQSAQDGFLYVVAESAEPGGRRSWSWLFPEPSYQSGSAQVMTGKDLTIPTTGQYLQLTGGPTVDVVHMVWAEAPLQQLETIKRSVFMRNNGDELLPADAEGFVQLLKQAAKPVEERRQMETFVRGSGSIAAVSFSLGHL